MARVHSLPAGAYSCLDTLLTANGLCTNVLIGQAVVSVFILQGLYKPSHRSDARAYVCAAQAGPQYQHSAKCNVGIVLAKSTAERPLFGRGIW